jgi:hypothetical protein
MEIKVKVELNEEEPIRIWLRGNKLEIIEIEDRWYSEECVYFKIFTDNARHYILKRYKCDGVWKVREIFKDSEI